MKILLGSRDNVDFDEPIKMTKEQMNRFIAFLRSTFDVVDVISTKIARAERVGDKPEWPRSWTLDELKLLYEIEDTHKVAERLGRSWMSVDIMRGKFIPEFLDWASNKGIDLLKEDTKKLIEEFLKEKQDLRREKREESKKLHKSQKIEKQIIELEDEKKKLVERLLVSSVTKTYATKEIIKKEDKIEKLRKKLKKLKSQE